MGATKKRGLNIIRNKHIAYYLAIVLILISLMIQVVEFIAVSMLDRFLLENLFAFLFEIVTNGFLIYALITKNNALIEVSLVVLKVFEGTYYPLRSFQRLDTLIYGGGSDFYIVSHILFASAAFSLLLALIFFCIYKYKDTVKHWSAMKIAILVAAFFMLLIVIIYIIAFIIIEAMPWTEILEPISLVFLFVGMFMASEYVEEETIYEEAHTA